MQRLEDDVTHLVYVLNNVTPELVVDLLCSRLVGTLLRRICLPQFANPENTEATSGTRFELRDHDVDRAHLVERREREIIHLDPDGALPIIFALTKLGMGCR